MMTAEHSGVGHEPLDLRFTCQRRCGCSDSTSTETPQCGHETKIDVRDVGLGDEVIAFVNEGIANPAVVAILSSMHTPKAKWQQLEIDAAIWTEVAKGGCHWIVRERSDLVCHSQAIRQGIRTHPSHHGAPAPTGTPSSGIAHGARDHGGD